MPDYQDEVDWINAYAHRVVVRAAVVMFTVGFVVGALVGRYFG